MMQLTEFKEILKTSLSDKNKDQLISLIEKYFPPIDLDLSQENGDNIQRIVEGLFSANCILREHGFLDLTSISIEDYDFVSHFKIQLGYQNKTVLRFIVDELDLSIFTECGIDTLSDVHSHTPIVLGGRLWVIPTYSAIQEIITKELIKLNKDNHEAFLVRALDVFTTIHLRMLVQADNLFPYEKLWHNVQISRISEILRAIKTLQEEIPNALTVCIDQKTLVWKKDKLKVLERLYDLLHGTMIPKDVGREHFENMFNGTSISNFGKKIVWLDNLIPAKRKGISTLTTVFKWIFDKELIAIESIQISSHNDQIKPILIGCFLNESGEPIKRVTAVKKVTGPKHEQLKKRLDSLLDT